MNREQQEKFLRVFESLSAVDKASVNSFAEFLLSRAGRLTSLDCESGASALHPCGSNADVRVVILYSGLEKQLSGTGYNLRVSECEAAARALLTAEGMDCPQTPRLRHVPSEVYEAHVDALPAKALADLGGDR